MTHSVRVVVPGAEDDWIPGMQDYFGTDLLAQPPARDFAERAHRCYELAFLAAVRTDLRPSARLVHGSWHGLSSERICHAWVEVKTAIGILIWEPITGTLAEAEAWRKYVRAWDEVTYTPAVAEENARRLGDFGRWHESRYT